MDERVAQKLSEVLETGATRRIHTPDVVATETLLFGVLVSLSEISVLLKDIKETEANLLTTARSILHKIGRGRVLGG